MHSYSMVIRNARIVDGSGVPSFKGDLAVAGDRIAAIGKVSGRGDVEIDAAGQVLAPGFIDIHTHYDPQLCWDRLAVPSPEHGVTSIVIGNCSMSLAPVRPDSRENLIGWFGSVEDMEGGLLRRIISFEWETFGEYLAELRRGLGPNVGAFLGHAVLRYYVMGDEAQRRAATREEVAHMVRILREALAKGALGLSFTFNHLDNAGEDLPCRYADRSEIAALMKEVAAAGRMVEVAPNLRPGADPLEQFELFGALALETGARCTLSPVLHLPSRGNLHERMIERLDYWRAQGAELFAQTQVRPLDIVLSLAKGSGLFGGLPTWRRIMDQPLDTRMALLADPSNRETLRNELEGMSGVFARLVVKKVTSPGNERLQGCELGKLAQAGRRHLADVLLDIALADRLETVFSLTDFMHADVNVVHELITHPGMHVGSADAGAHINAFAGAGDTTYLLEKFVRIEKKMSLEAAIRLITSDLARDWRIPDRGKVAVGQLADLVIFDPETIARGPEIWVEDLPGGYGRYVRHATGISHVIVNGVEIFGEGRYADARPGRLL